MIPGARIETSCSWALVIARGARALIGYQRPREITVLSWDYLPGGLMYEIENASVPEWVHSDLITPLLGKTPLSLVNLMDGREEPLGTSMPWFSDRVAMCFHLPEEGV